MIKIIKHIINMIAVSSLIALSFIGCTVNINTEKKEQVTITYQNGENVTSSVPEKKIVDKGYILTQEDVPSITVSDNYKAIGWYNGDVKVKVGDIVTSNIKLTSKAVLKNIELTITYVNGENVTSSLPAKKTVKNGYKLTSDDLPKITASEFYNSDGWYNGDEKAKVGDLINTNITLTSKAVLQDGKVSISYANGEHMICYLPETKIVNKGYILTAGDIPSYILADADYTPIGWFSGEEPIKAGYVVNKNITITSKGKPLYANINYSANPQSGITFLPSTKKVRTGSRLTESDFTICIVPEGKYLTGYYYENGTKAKIGDNVESDITLYPHTAENLQQNQNTLQLNYAQKDKVQNLQHSQNNRNVEQGYKLVEADLYPPIVDCGYCFDGWFIDNNIKAEIGTVINENTLLVPRIKIPKMQ